MAELETKAPDLRLDIERDRLDDEWVDQPRMFHAWSVYVADCQYGLDCAKTKLDVVVAELDSAMRTDPKQYGLEKTTDKVIEAALPGQPDYKLAIARVNRAKHTLEVAKAAVASLEHRKRALSLLVELFIRDYYSDRAGRTISDSADGEYNKREVRSRARRRMQQEADGDDDIDRTA